MVPSQNIPFDVDILVSLCSWKHVLTNAAAKTQITKRVTARVFFQGLRLEAIILNSVHEHLEQAPHPS